MVPNGQRGTVLLMIVSALIGVAMFFLLTINAISKVISRGGQVAAPEGFGQNQAPLSVKIDHSIEPE